MKRKHSRHKKLHSRSRSSHTKRWRLLNKPGLIIISLCLVLLFGVSVAEHKQTVLREVAGVSIIRQGIFSKATIELPQVSGAAAYNIYYSPVSDTGFINAVRGISIDNSEYTILYLRQGVQYKYQISALDPTGREFWFSQTQIITSTQNM